MSDLTQKLKALYARAILRPEEAGDEARLNEARTAAFLLLKIARESGVQLRFVPATEADQQQSRQGYSRYDAPRPRGWGPNGPAPAPEPVRRRTRAAEVCVFCGKSVSTRVAFTEQYCTHVG